VSIRKRTGGYNTFFFSTGFCAANQPQPKHHLPPHGWRPPRPLIPHILQSQGEEVKEEESPRSEKKDQLEEEEDPWQNVGWLVGWLVDLSDLPLGFRLIEGGTFPKTWV